MHGPRDLGVRPTNRADGGRCERPDEAGRPGERLDPELASPFDPSDYLQLACMGRRSVEILLHLADGGEGCIQVVAGETWAAEDPQGTGVEAFRRLLRAPGARAECRVLQGEPLERSLDPRWELLLLDAARLADELCRDGGRDREEREEVVSSGTGEPLEPACLANRDVPAARRGPASASSPALPRATQRDPGVLAELLFSDLAAAESTEGSGPLLVRTAPAARTPEKNLAIVPPPRTRPPPLPRAAKAPARDLSIPPPAEPVQAESTGRPFPPAARAPFTDRRPTARFRAAAVLAITLAVGGALTGGALLVPSRGRGEARAEGLAAELGRADDRLRSGRLAGPAGDSALDHLVAARALAPDDPRPGRRLGLLAETFAALGERALVRGDLTEATAHYQAALRADPSRDEARHRLLEIAASAAARPPAR